MPRHSARYDISGQQFGRLTVIGIVGVDAKTRQTKWQCQCSCGKMIEILRAGLVHGGTKSCGRLAVEATRARSTTHGLYHTPEHAVWKAMVNRCHNPNSKSYSDYGARGITVCPRWRASFADFMADMGRRPSVKHTIERRVNSDGYHPGNCYWATRKAQNRNTRRNRYLTFNGETMPLSAWAERIGLRPNTLRERLQHGWPLERALATPLTRPK